MPPVGAPATAQTPPIQIGTPVTQPRPPLTTPQVDSFDEEAYRCKPGDTFQSISTRFLGVDKYAQALLMFNRAHPMAGEGLLQMPPVLSPGTIVYIPQAKILEKRYGGVIQDLTPTRNDQKPAQPAASTPSPTPQAQQPQSGWRKYKVRGAGEWMLDIARRTLGNPERWREIYRLNESFRPEQVVPGNAVIYLPPDARVDSDHTP
jgi:nucleoid-associated protein YgaU